MEEQLMVAYSIKVDDTASPDLARLVNAMTNRIALYKDILRRIANDLRAHFRQRQQAGPRNKFGAQSSGFWAEIRDSVNDGEITSVDGGKVGIAHPAIAQKVYGGTIRKDDKKLAIPARMEAYGKSPRMFDFLRAIVFQSGAVALVEAERTEITRTRGINKDFGYSNFKGAEARGIGSVWYWLVDSVTQKADPNALPKKEVLEAGMLDTAQKHFERQTKLEQ
jgi:hypothetical protein